VTDNHDDVVIIGEFDDIVDSEFDESTHTWTMQTGRGERHRARIVIATNGQIPASHDRDRGELRPYLGVAVHGVPNYFVVTGPDVVQQKQYIAECLELMKRTGSTRIEVRYSTQRVFNDRSRKEPDWRRMRSKIRSAFDLSSHTVVEDEVYDGPATVRVGDHDHPARVRLTGRVDPIDGRYHWQGTVFDHLPIANKLPQPVTLTIDDRTAHARITERTPQGGYSVVGVGAPPFTLAAPAL
jgi:hypothetical protein